MLTHSRPKRETNCAAIESNRYKVNRNSRSQTYSRLCMHARAVSDLDVTAVSDSTLVSTLESTLSLRSTVQLGP